MDQQLVALGDRRDQGDLDRPMLPAVVLAERELALVVDPEHSHRLGDIPASDAVIITPRHVLRLASGHVAVARHSITLALSALGVIRLPIPPVEAAIALSIVFLSIEIVRGDPNSLTYRYPIAVSSSFGLLHGFGFAAVLGETGLPQTEIPAALLFFNVGVEVGQILFVAVVILVYQFLRWVGRAFIERDLSIDALRPLQAPAAYAVGMLAAFWMVERIATFWTS